MTMSITLTATKTDAQIQQDVLRELKWDPRVDETEVGVQVRKGIVTLTGTVTSYAKRLAAAEAAHRVLHVLDVANDLQVRIPGIGRKTDAEIAEAARRAMLWDVFVPDDRIRTTVSDGWITLEGEVNRWTQREDAERAIRNLAGVAGVVNRITVAVPRANTEEIRGAIEGALERQAEREGRRIEVNVRDGTVTLSGSVRSWGERNAVEQAAGYAQGVRKVESRLIVDTCM
jgi:osmotically-inducible protein OsmY